MGQPRHQAPAAEGEPSSSNLPFMVLAVLLMLGTGLLLAVAFGIFSKDTTPYILLEHLGSAFIVASTIGFTYEWLVHKKREALLRAFAEDQLKATSQALDAFVATTPREIFSLLEDIATRVQDKIPTLYVPAREEGSEYTFAGSVEYFTYLIAARRPEVVGVLREWIKESSNYKLKFLASDFIGLFKLTELRDDIKSQVHWAEWETTSWEIKAYRLNYCWAASRADPKAMYGDLAQLMRNTPFEDIQRWVLFVPRQMRDKEFLVVIREYLGRDDLTPEQLGWAVPALADLWEVDQRGVRGIVRKHKSRFNNDMMANEMRKAWRERNLSADVMLRAIGIGQRISERPDPFASDVAQ